MIVSVNEWKCVSMCEWVCELVSQCEFELMC